VNPVCLSSSPACLNRNPSHWSEYPVGWSRNPVDWSRNPVDLSRNLHAKKFLRTIIGGYLAEYLMRGRSLYVPLDSSRFL